jgi:hypothetical protein
MDIETDLEGKNVIVDHDIHEFTNIDDHHFIKLITESSIPLFESSQLNKLTSILMILNTYATHRCINGFVDEYYPCYATLFCQNQILCLSHIMKQKF